MAELWAELWREGTITPIGVVVLKDDDDHPLVDLYPDLTGAEDQERLDSAFAVGDLFPGLGGPKPDGPPITAAYEGGEEVEVKHERLSERWFDDVLMTLPHPYSAKRIPPPEEPGR
jgi:hypothetical protein